MTGKIALLPHWKIIYEIPKKNLKANTSQLNRHILLAVGLTLLLMALLLGYLLKSFVAPLLSLKKTMVNVQKGDKKIRAEVTRPDEIGEVAYLFNETLEEVYRNEENYRKASVALMQEQIKPHFLYNTLDTIQWLILETEDEKAVQVVDELTVFLRKGLNKGREVITLANELAHVRSYWEIQKIRYEKLQDLTIEVKDNLWEETLLHFILQPIVENALYHGIRPSEKENLYLKISVMKEEKNLNIVVANNGVLPTKEELNALNTGNESGFGLKNVKSRLENFYQLKASLTFEMDEEELRAIFQLPQVERSSHELENFNC